MKKFLKTVREVLFPNDLTCDLCGRETFGTNICKDCIKTLVFNNGATCPICGRKTVRPELCAECKYSPPSFKKAVSALVYDGGAVMLINKFKSGRAHLKEYFADKICEKLNPDEYDCVVSVPLNRKTAKKRGFNQSELLARAVSERLKVPYLKGALIKIEDTDAQKALSQKERRENLKGCFEVVKREDVACKRVLVADDVLTTGATADEITKTLIKAGAAVVCVATVASVEYKKS